MAFAGKHMAGKSKYSLNSLIFFSIIFLSLGLMQWGCGKIPEEGTIVYDVEFPPADSDEAQVEAQAVQHHRTSS